MPSATRSCAGFWVDAGPARLRLDCGAGTVPAMGRFRLPWETLTHQFISHFHLDHVGELPALLFSFKYGRSTPRGAPLRILGPAGLAGFLASASALHQVDLLDQDFPVGVQELAPGDALAVADGVTLRVWKTPHTPESLAVRIEADGQALGYTGDTAPSPELASFFADVDVLVAECSHLESARGTPHLTAGDVAALATGARARRLVATHFYFDPDATGLAERLARLYPGAVTIAVDGMTIDGGD
jgi:ribonuclease BN (tRNA processing enzyme)